MAHDVFISHSSRDKTVSDAVCAALEQAGIRCWIAPRDVQPGRSFAGEITRAIQQGEAMVLIFSAHSNTSEQVLREVQLAVEAKLHILQFRIEEVLLNDDLKYYLSTPHWLDALTPPLENHLDRLAGSLKVLLGKIEPGTATSSLPPQLRERKAIPSIVADEPKRRGRKWWLWALLAVLFLSGLATVVLFRENHVERNVADRRPPSNAPAVSTDVTKGSLLFADNFQTNATSVAPLFGPNVMSARNANGEGEITGNAPGVLPAMFDKFTAGDFVLECEVRAPTVPAGAAYGLIFRAADVVNGGIARYYVLLIDPNNNTLVLNMWKETRWITGAAQSLPMGLVEAGRKSRITLEALGNRFRVFIEGQTVVEMNFVDPFVLKEGKIGFCLVGVDSQPWTVYFDNLEVSLPRKTE